MRRRVSELNRNDSIKRENEIVRKANRWMQSVRKIEVKEDLYGWRKQ